MTRRHDEADIGPQIPSWIGTQPRGAPGRGGSVYGDGPAHNALERRVREQAEGEQGAALEDGLRGAGPRGLRLVEPWAPNTLPGEGWIRAGPKDPVQPEHARLHLALVSVDDEQHERLSAMVVMVHILDAWRSAERELDMVAEGRPERSHIKAHVDTLRSLYHGLFAQVRGEQTEGELG